MTCSFSPEKNYCIILEPVWLAVYKKYFAQNWLSFTSFFLDIDEDLQEERLGFLRRESITTISERKKDFLYMKEYEYDYILDGSLPIEDNIINIFNIINNNDKN
jgi:hypothetical protein